jgi:hypothetical protein
VSLFSWPLVRKRDIKVGNEGTVGKINKNGEGGGESEERESFAGKKHDIVVGRRV